MGFDSCGHVDLRNWIGKQIYQIVWCIARAWRWISLKLPSKHNNTLVPPKLVCVISIHLPKGGGIEPTIPIFSITNCRRIPPKLTKYVKHGSRGKVYTTANLKEIYLNNQNTLKYSNGHIIEAKTVLKIKCNEMKQYRPQWSLMTAEQSSADPCNQQGCRNKKGHAAPTETSKKVNLHTSSFHHKIQVE